MNLHKNQFVKFAVTAFTSIILAACSGGGGGNNSTTSNQPMPNKTEKTTANTMSQNSTTESAAERTNDSLNNFAGSHTAGTPNTTSTTETAGTAKPAQTAPTNTTTQNQETNKVTGSAFIMSKGKNISLARFSRPAEIGDVNTFVTENGMRFTLVPGSHKDPDFYIDEDPFENIRKFISGTNYKYTRWGFADFFIADSYLLAQGINPTAIMPSGSATYKGEAIQILSDTGLLQNTVYRANSDFTVDFTNKTLVGKITPINPSFNEVNLSATINGNEFQGKLNGVETGGGFYGPQAEELTGFYTKDSKQKDDFIGVFGAIKQ